jgi:hypothetical protein
MGSTPAEKYEDHIAKIRKEVKTLEKLIYENIEKHYAKITAILKANTSSILGSKKEELEVLEDDLNKAKTIDVVYGIFRRIQTADELIKSKKVVSFDVLQKKIEFPEPMELLKIADIIKQAEKSIQEIGTDKDKKEADKKTKEEANKKAKEEANKKAKEETDRKTKEEANKKAKEETDRKTKEEANKKIKEEAKKKVKEEEKAKELAMKEDVKKNKWYPQVTSCASEELDLSGKGILFL